MSEHEPYGAVGVALGWALAIGAMLALLYAIKRRFYL